MRGRASERAESPVDERRKRVSQTSGRGASLVFLAVFGMWGVGFGGSSGAGAGGVVGRGMGKMGRVVTRPEVYVQNTVHPSVYFAPSPKGVVQLQYVPSSSYTDGEHPEPVPPPADEPDRTSWTWIIGRISAWTCTTLYLTSRMPQIWKNVSGFRCAAYALRLTLIVTVHSPIGRWAFHLALCVCLFRQLFLRLFHLDLVAHDG
jgi:hypothetical protein